MANSADRLIGPAAGLEESGKGLRFDVKDRDGKVLPAFVVRYDSQFFGYLNQCGHIAMQLDYMPGEFFSDEGQTLMCATHGAEYAPDTGACLGGPCFGVGLQPLLIVEEEGDLFLESPELDVVVKECLASSTQEN